MTKMTTNSKGYIPGLCGRPTLELLTKVKQYIYMLCYHYHHHKDLILPLSLCFLFNQAGLSRNNQQLLSPDLSVIFRIYSAGFYRTEWIYLMSSNQRAMLSHVSYYTNREIQNSVPTINNKDNNAVIL